MRQTPAPTAPVPLPPLGPLDADGERRLRRCLRSPSGQAIMITLARTQGALSARELAEKAFVSTTSARDQGWRAARLGFAVQDYRDTGNGPPATTWQITERGRDFVADLLAAA